MVLKEFSVQNQMNEEPAFAWWGLYKIRKKACIDTKTKPNYWQKMHKFGIRLTNTVKQSVELYYDNGNTLWWDILMTEMNNIRTDFEVLKYDIKKLV